MGRPHTHFQANPAYKVQPISTLEPETPILVEQTLTAVPVAMYRTYKDRQDEDFIQANTKDYIPQTSTEEYMSTTKPHTNSCEKIL